MISDCVRQTSDIESVKTAQELVSLIHFYESDQTVSKSDLKFIWCHHTKFACGCIEFVHILK